MAAFYDNLAATFGIEKTMEIAEAAATWIQKNNDIDEMAQMLHIAEQKRQKIVSEIIHNKKIKPHHMDTPMRITENFDSTSANRATFNKEHVILLKNSIYDVSQQNNNIFTPNQVLEHMENDLGIRHFHGGQSGRLISLKGNLECHLAKMFRYKEVAVA